MSVISFLFAVHLNGRTNVETKTFSTPKLEKLYSPKSSMKQPLLGSITAPNFTQIRCTIIEKWSQNVSHTHLYL